MSHNNGNGMIYGIYKSAGALLNSAHRLHELGIKVHDCYTPHPIHGLDQAIGIKRSRLPVVAFLCGSLGTLAAIGLTMFTNVFEWPMNIGGKPSHTYVVTFVPVTFELTVLFTAFGMALFFFIRTKLVHGKVEKLVDLRQTDDLYIIAIENEPGLNKQELNKALIETGADEIREQE